MVNYLLLKVLKRRRHGEERHGRKCLKIYNHVCLSVCVFECGKSSLKGNQVIILCWKNTLCLFSKIFPHCAQLTQVEQSPNTLTHTSKHTCNNSLMSTRCPYQMSDGSDREQTLSSSCVQPIMIINHIKREKHNQGVKSLFLYELN